MKALFGVLAVLALTGCNRERLSEGAEKERTAPTINVAGKQEPAPPVGISETMVLVEGRWMRAKDEGITWRVECGGGECKPKLIRK